MATVFFAAMLASFHQDGANAELASWVPDKYSKYFYRHVDERPAWKRAVEFLDIDIGESGPAFALVAGVSRYPKMSGRAADLWPARIDVEKMVAYLEREPESFNEIVVLLDDDVTAENLGYFLTRYFPRRLSQTSRSRFLFAYSGHGMTAANGRGYLLTSQAANLEDRFDGGISLASLRAQFQEIVDTGHQVLGLINACYGVDFHRLSLAFGPEVAPLPQREGAHAITAGGAGEVTWHDPNFGDGDGPKGSLFFEAVLAALDGRADQLPHDGIVTVGELETYLKTTVSRFTDEKQNPTGGDLIATRSPGGFFFLDRNRQVEGHNATPLKGQWWASLSFGGGSTGVTALDRGPPRASPVTNIAKLPEGDRPAGPEPDSSPQGLIASLQAVGVDFSVPEAELLQYLANREFTPYPAMAEALVAMIGKGRLKKPVFLDVIVWNYENAPNAGSPREVSEVDGPRLRAAIVDGYNTRYGATETAYEDIELPTR